VERAAAAVASCPVTPVASRAVSLRRGSRGGGGEGVDGDEARGEESANEGEEGEGQGEERELRRANDVWGGRMHRLAVKAGNLVRGREGDRERGRMRG